MEKTPNSLLFDAIQTNYGILLKYILHSENLKEAKEQILKIIDVLLNEEFNQETEEELLDIPTFLRRQAN